MSQSPKVSIIMPVQKTASYLPQCLDSILNQTYENWELIAVDDFSSDNSFDILRDYSRRESRIRAIRNDSKGIVHALQNGYAQSTGGFITRMDSDDIMPSGKIEAMAFALSKHGVETVVSGLVSYFNDDQPLGDGYRKYASWLNDICIKGNYWDEVFRECVIPSACWMMHRSDFDAIGGFQASRMPEDYDLCFRMWSHGLKPVGIHQVLHHWRDRSDRASRTQDIYKDNRFFELKMHYFQIQHPLEQARLVLWGAGRNGKYLARLLRDMEMDFTWVTDNPNKVGLNIYDKVLCSPADIPRKKATLKILIAVANRRQQNEIGSRLKELDYAFAKDYWFFM